MKVNNKNPGCSYSTLLLVALISNSLKSNHALYPIHSLICSSILFTERSQERLDQKIKISRKSNCANIALNRTSKLLPIKLKIFVDMAIRETICSLLKILTLASSIKVRETRIKNYKYGMHSDFFKTC